MPLRDDYRVLDFDVKGTGRDAEQVTSSADLHLPCRHRSFENWHAHGGCL